MALSLGFKAQLPAGSALQEQLAASAVLACAFLAQPARSRAAVAGDAPRAQLALTARRLAVLLVFRAPSERTNLALGWALASNAPEEPQQVGGVWPIAWLLYNQQGLQVAAAAAVLAHREGLPVVVAAAGPNHRVRRAKDDPNEPSVVNHRLKFAPKARS